MLIQGTVPDTVGLGEDAEPVARRRSAALRPSSACRSAARAPTSRSAPSSAAPTRPSTAARARSRWRARPARRTPARPPARRRWWSAPRRDARRDRRCGPTRRARSSSRPPSACSRGNTGGTGVADPGADPTLPADRPVDDALRLGPGRTSAPRSARRAERQDPAGGGDRLARLVRAADRLERPRSPASRAPASRPAAASTGSSSGAPARRRRPGTTVARRRLRAATGHRLRLDRPRTPCARALATLRAAARPGGPTLLADVAQPVQERVHRPAVVTGHGHPDAGHRPPRASPRSPDPTPARRLPEAAGHRRRGADPLRRPQRRQRRRS